MNVHDAAGSADRARRRVDQANSSFPLFRWADLVALLLAEVIGLTLRSWHAPGSTMMILTSTPRDNWRLWLAGIILVALTLRLTKLWISTPLVLGGDEPQYLELAMDLARYGKYQSTADVPNLWQGGHPGEPTAYRTPVLPAFLAFHFRLLGPAYIYPRSALVFLSALTCVLIAIVGRRLISSQAGLIAGACWAVWPPTFLSFYAADRFLCENLGVFLLIAYIATSLGSLDRTSALLASVSGALIGLAVLTRGYFLFILPFSLLFYSSIPLARGKRVQLAASFLVGLSLTLGSWVGRNWLLLGEPIVSTQTEAFYLGNNPWARGSFSGDMLTLGWKSPQFQRMEQRYPGFRQMGELERSKAWRTEARHCMINDPARFAWLLARKTLIFWGPFQNWSWGFYRYHFAYALAMPFFALGGYRLARSRSLPGMIHLFGPILGVYAAALMTYSHDRYRFTVEPFILLIAAAGLLALLDDWGSRFHKRADSVP